MKSLFTTLAFALCLALPVLAEDGGKTDPPQKTEATDDAKKAIAGGVSMLEDRSFDFSAKLDMELNGSPVLNTEVKGAHKKPYTKMAMEVMGQQMEIYTDGKTSLQKNPQSGEWEKSDNTMQDMFDAKKIQEIIKSAEWDEKESKVGSHVCRVAKAKVDKAKVEKMIAKSGGMGGQAKITKASLRFYLDKKDGKVRRYKLQITMSFDMGGGNGGGAMPVDVTSDLRLKYSSNTSIELPAEVKDLFEGKAEPKDPKDDKQPTEPDEEEED